MRQTKYLNRIVFINVANMEYANVELGGNVCFVGSNNLGKTTLQRAVLFFYNADQNNLGINTSARQKPFEEYYFPHANSFIIYEVGTHREFVTGEVEEDFFHVIVYKHNNIQFRFVDGPFRKELYIDNNVPLTMEELLKKFDGEGIIYAEKRVDTFTRYRNILYGIEPDKMYRRYSLIKGNDRFKNIPKAISKIFLSSDSDIRADFVKDFVAYAIGDSDSSIDLKHIESQLDKFLGKFKDIEDFYKKDNQTLSTLISDNFIRIREIRQSQRNLAQELGSAVKFAQKAVDKLDLTINNNNQGLEKVKINFVKKEQKFNSKIGDLNQEIGAQKSELNKAVRLRNQYEKEEIESKIKLVSNKTTLRNELESRETELSNLTNNSQDIEQQFKSLFDNLENESVKLQNKFDQDLHALKQEKHEQVNNIDKKFYEDKDKLKEKENLESKELNDELMELKLEEATLKNEEKTIFSKVFFSAEQEDLKNKIKNNEVVIGQKKTEIKIKETTINSLKQEGEFVRKNTEKELSNFRINIERQIETEKNAIKAIETMLESQKNSFYDFLNDQMPGWQETIGRVCDERILFRRDLQPKKLDQGKQNLYGVEISIDHLSPTVRSIDELHTEIASHQSIIEKLETDFFAFKENVTNEEQKKISPLASKVSQLKEEVEKLNYEIQQLEGNNERFEIILDDYKEKAEAEKAKSLTEFKTVKETLIQKLSETHLKLKEIKDKYSSLHQKIVSEKDKENKEVVTQFNIKEVELKSTLQEETKRIQERKHTLEEQKEKSRKKKGVDRKVVKQVEERIHQIKADLKEIEKLEPLIIQYKNDNKEYLQKIPLFENKLHSLQEEVKSTKEQFEAQKKEFELTEKKLLSELDKLKSQKKDFENGLKAFENFKQNNFLYDQFKSIIENAEQIEVKSDIIVLTQELGRLKDELSKKYNDYKNQIAKFIGNFRNNNELGFKVTNPEVTDSFDHFANYLREFINENRIETTIIEVDKTLVQIIHSIAGKVKTLKNQMAKVEQTIRLMEKDFRQAEFGHQLIEYIKVKSEPNENKIIRKLKAITKFKEENEFNFGAKSLFSSHEKSQVDLDKEAVSLLNDLHRILAEEPMNDLRLQDFFKVYFKIKEGRNETDWIEKIEKVGSHGTDILVKSIILITLLKVFMKESSQNANEEVKIHCIIDEIGTISSVYLKELIQFANQRNIYLVNGVPNKSNLETCYNFNFIFRKQENGYVQVRKLITNTIEV